MAVSADGQRWFLLNASPDIRAQVATLPTSTEGVRTMPFEAIVLTDGELDHTLGLALVREGRSLALYMTPATRDVLEADSRLLPVVRAFASVSVHPLSVGAQADLLNRDGSPSGLRVEAIPLASHAPRFSSVHAPGVACALMIRDAAGSVLAYVPCCAEVDSTLREALATANMMLFDGTFWSDRELVDLGISDRTALQMGHMPVGGPNGSLEQLSGLTWGERVFVHINNTNPILLEDSAERREAEAAGFQVGYDGMTLSC